MQRLLFRAIAILLLTVAAAWPQQKSENKAAPPADPCPEATTDEVKTRCWDDLAQKADANLTALYQKIEKAIRAKIADQSSVKDHEQGALEKLKAAQLAWKHYRDAQCAAEEQQYDGGTIAPSVHAGCVKELSDRRRDQLQKNYALYLQ
jgi:uncharacterized protein YecT (DUF1311 family)